MHLTSLQEALPQIPEPIYESFQFLTEVMIEYGNTYREHRSLRNRQQQLESEIEVAVTMQQTLLSDVRPTHPTLEIGLISVPAKKMSGDYYNFIQHEDHSFSVAIADITGKGVPAALCMSMIKYAMDATFPEPAKMLFYLNGVVERNMDPSMFVTMLCGRYDLGTHSFKYAVAGHEPGIWYEAKTQTYHEVSGKGIALGIKREAVYPEYEIALAPGDCLILMTDGVTERKVGQRYMQREELIEEERTSATAQMMVDNLYRRLLQVSNFELPDDHTMIVIRRKEDRHSGEEN